MTVLAADRFTEQRDSEFFSYPVAASTKIFQGAIVMLDASGNATEGAAATGQVAAGVCQKLADNSSGAAAAINVKVRQGTFVFNNSAAGEEITKSEIGDTCFIVDDQTVGKTDATGTLSAAGTVVAVDGSGVDGVWVKFDFVDDRS